MVNTALIEEFRKKKGINQTDFAYKINKLTQSGYSNKIAKNTFSDDEVAIICKILGIKKEQIELKQVEHVNEIKFLTAKALQTESTLKVMLGALAEIMAHQTGENVTKVRTELESAVDSLSRQVLKQSQNPI